MIYCNICKQRIKLSKVREHVYSHCLRDDEFLFTYGRVMGMMTMPIIKKKMPDIKNVFYKEE